MFAFLFKSVAAVRRTKITNSVQLFLVATSARTAKSPKASGVGVLSAAARGLEHVPIASFTYSGNEASSDLLLPIQALDARRFRRFILRPIEHLRTNDLQ